MPPYREELEGRLQEHRMDVFLNYRATAGNWVEPHWHPCLELLHVFGGEARQRLQDAQIALHTGDTLLIAPGAVHATSALEDDCYISVTLFLPQEALPSLYLPAGGSAGMERLFSQMQEEYALRRPGYGLLAQGLLLQILGLLQRHGKPVEHPAAVDPDEGRRLEEFIRSRLTQGISLQEAAEFAGYSPAYLSRRFPRLMGQPFKAYVDNMKIQAARGMLADRVRVNETAAALGYETPSSFCRAFKRVTGQTPSEYLTAMGQKRDSTE